MGSTVKKLTKNPLGTLAGAAFGPAGMLIGGSSSLSDILLGKKQGGYSADAISGEIRNAQGQGIASAQKGLGEVNKVLDTPSENIVRQQSALQEKGILSSAQDARRRAQQLMAQRGLQNSSLGLSSDRSITQNQGAQLGAVRAALPGQIRNQQIQDAQTRMSAGQGLFAGLGGSQGIRFQGQEGQRSGGLLGIAGSLAPVAGMIAGGMAGGPVGASIGGSLGSSVGQATKQNQYGQNVYSGSSYA